MIDRERIGTIVVVVLVVGSMVMAPVAGQSATYSGEINLTGSEASDGTNYAYNLGDDPSIDDFSVNVTGVDHTAPDSTSGILSSGSSTTVDVVSDQPPTAEEITLSAPYNERQQSVDGSQSSSGSDSVSVDSDIAPSGEEITLSAPYEERSESRSGSSTGSETISLSINAGLDVKDGSLSITGSKSNYDREIGFFYVDPNDGQPSDNVELNVSGVDSLSAVELHGRQMDGSSVTVDMSIEGTSMGSSTWSAGESSYKRFDAGSLDVSSLSSVTVSLSATGGNLDTGGVTLIPIESMSPTSISASTDDGHSLSFGSGGTKSIDLSTSTTELTVTTDLGSADYDLSWTEVDGVGDISGTVGSTSISTSGPLTSSVTKSVDLSDGSNSIDLSYSGAETLSHTTSWTETDAVVDPTVTVGGSTVSHSGPLTSPVTKSVDLSDGSNSVDASYSGTSDALEYDLSWTETTETRDPTVSINGETVGVSGTLSDGETRSLDVDPAWIEPGQNNVSISTNSPTGGPGSLVGFDYSHLTTGPSESTDVSATEWQSTINSTKTFAAEQSDAKATIKFAEDVVGVSSVETRKNGGAWGEPTNWSMSGSQLVASVGNVDAGDKISVRGEGRKVDVSDGTIDVVEPTIEGTELSTRIRVNSTTGSGVSIDVSGTDPANKVHHISSSDWSASDRARVASDGSQVLELPNAVGGAEATVETAPLSVSPQSGEALVEIDDAEEPRFSIEPGENEGDYLEIGYLDTTSGETYELKSISDDRVVDRGTASSPVWFSAPDDSATYVVEIGAATGAVGMIGGTGGESGGLGGPLVLGIGMVGVLGSALVGRRVGLSWQITLPVSIVAVVGIAELASPTSLVATISGDLLRGSSEPLVATVVGTTLLGGLFWIDRRISADVPRWLYGGVGLAAVAWVGTAVAPDLLSGSSQPLVALAAGSTLILGLVWAQWRTDREIPRIATGTVGALAAVWIAETIAPGVLADPLRAGLEEVGPLAWLAILGGGIYAIRGWVRSRNTPDTQVTLSLGGDNQ